MEAPLINNYKKGPEAIIQEQIVTYLKLRDWFVKETHGNMYQNGLPDLFATHRTFGGRWIEVKNPLKYAFTPAQLECFPKMVAFGTGVWIMTAATDYEYRKLNRPCNWHTYLK